MGDHRDRLRAELLAAAHRQGRPTPANRSALRRTAPLLAAAALLVVVAIGSMLRTDPVGAEVFRIDERSDGTVVIEVIGAVKDPEMAAAQLEAAGFSATLEPVPTPASLVGRIVAVAAEPAAGTREADLTTESDGQHVVQLRAEPGTLGTVTVMYGRPADPGELYMANDTVPDCDQLAWQLVTDDLIRRIAADYGPHIRWKDAGPPLREITADDIDDGAVVISILGLSSDSALVTVGDRSVERDAMSC